jgi:hypothetical protein
MEYLYGGIVHCQDSFKEDVPLACLYRVAAFKV